MQACRTLAVRGLKGLEGVIGVTYVCPFSLAGESLQKLVRCSIDSIADTALAAAVFAQQQKDMLHAWMFYSISSPQQPWAPQQY
jgi:glutathionyl-hydroquinone reductase